MKFTHFMYVTKHFDRTEEDYGIYAFECRHCNQQFESDTYLHELWQHIATNHSVLLGDWAKPELDRRR